MKKIFLALALISMVFAIGCHKENNVGDDNGGGNGGNNGGGGDTPYITYTVTFKANGGMGTMQPQVFNNGVARTLTPNSFTRENYIFAGWNTKNDGSGTAYSDKQSITVSQDMVLYAQWKTAVIITFNANGGTGEMEPQTFHIGVAQVLNANTYTRMNYVFVGWNSAGDGSGTNYINGQEITISGDMTLYAQWRIVPQGAIGGLFSVSETEQVFFSNGNLQYQASIGIWRFAENQWDYVGCQNPSEGIAGGTVTGSDNAYISSSYSGWIDLFGWGTSGYNHGANCYQPWSSSTDHNDYNAYGNVTYNLYDQTGKADWGYNAISNGGNQANQWRTLTSDEWRFLVFLRTTNSDISYAKAKVNGVAGLIILPDNWCASYYTLSGTDNPNAAYYANIITLSDWTNNLEAHGAVFLPAAGNRDGTSVGCVGVYGDYWSSSHGGMIRFRNYDLSMWGNSIFRGLSVRLVTDAK